MIYAYCSIRGAKQWKTTYYVTFEVASGDRIEFETIDTEYGLLVDHDAEKLTFQGTRYLVFERGNKTKKDGGSSPSITGL